MCDVNNSDFSIDINSLTLIRFSLQVFFVQIFLFFYNFFYYFFFARLLIGLMLQVWTAEWYMLNILGAFIYAYDNPVLSLPTQIALCITK